MFGESRADRFHRKTNEEIGLMIREETESLDEFLLAEVPHIMMYLSYLEEQEAAKKMAEAEETDFYYELSLRRLVDPFLQDFIDDPTVFNI